MIKVSVLLTALALVGCTANERTTTTVSHTSDDGQQRVAVTNTTEETTTTPPVTAEDVAAKTQDAVNVAGEFAAQTKDEFVAEAKVRLARIDQQIQEWDAKSESLKAEAKASWAKERERLRQRQAEMQLELEKLEKASGEAWGDLKVGATAAWNELSKGFSDAAARFEKDRNPEALP